MRKHQIRDDWNAPDVERYVETIPLKIAGYELLYDMTARLMKAGLAERNTAAELLIVGAGGGQELVTLGAFEPQWRFTALDPSQPMLAIAKKRTENVNLSHRVCFMNGTPEQLPSEAIYDGATCLLVLHFLKERTEKRQFLAQIAARLKPGAPFFLASINGNSGSPAFSVQMNAWKSHMTAHGISAETFDQFAASIGNRTFPVNGRAIASLLADCGFTNISRYFGSYLIESFIAFKK
ncbi:tRNA (cmo5U34)-methyltransferase [Evansella caseinilytica]|uniref:tRNA (Cmo5U34)-methyltransferase n=1 Tax=Evansella caseinilytica TaxID=1503961 RepID=A0A1H3QAJ5_9BACI|nr:class I SAM-dependent methyltransferase [Evansella caseinilytica]SDZ09719.1 tRNA (cmo5U34)-methyltransferase [Evansella caseinilytica]